MSISFFDYPSGEDYWSIVYVEDIVYFIWSNSVILITNRCLHIYLLVVLFFSKSIKSVSVTKNCSSLKLHQLVSLTENCIWSYVAFFLFELKLRVFYWRDLFVSLLNIRCINDFVILFRCLLCVKQQATFYQLA